MKCSAPMHLAKTQKVQIKIMEAKICPARALSMSKLVYESKQEDEDRLKQILSKTLGAWDTTKFSQKKKKNFINATRFCSTKVVTWHPCRFGWL